MTTATPPSPAPSSPKADQPESGGLPLRKIALILLVLIGVMALGRMAGGYVPQFAAWVEGLGALGPVVFILGYAIATVAFIPGSVLTLAAGAIFGLVEGAVYVFAAAVLGSTLAFLIARHGARAAIEKRIEGDARFATIDRAVASEGRKIVFLLRLSPIFPFNLLNYGLGLTQVRLIDYVVASVGMLPGTLLYVYTGKVAGDVAAVAGGVQSERGPAEWAVILAGLIATGLVTFYVTRIARQALDAATELEEVTGESA